MKRRLTYQDDDGGLDALLDTMTNVVGILVLVLIVAQLGVADVVSRVVSESRIDQQAIDVAQDQMQQKQQQQRELQRILYQPLELDADQLRQELARKTELLERRKKLLAEKQQEQNQYAIKIEQDKRQAEQNRQEIAESAQRRAELEKLVAASMEQKAQLEAMIDDTPVGKPPADLQISIPNPRPAPRGAKQLLLFAVGNQLFPANVDKFRSTAESKAKQLVTRFNLLRDTQSGIDPQAFAKYFERLKDQDDFFDVEYYVQDNKYPRLRLIPRVGRGASLKEVNNQRSRFYKQWLGGIDPSKYYARFLVLPDSYEVYTAARRAFSDAQIMAGWEPQPPQWVYSSPVPGIVLGPPPEPRPAPPPAPAPAKNPPKPPNLID